MRLTSSVAHCSRRPTPFPYTFQLLSIFPSAKKYCDSPMRTMAQFVAMLLGPMYVGIVVLTAVMSLVGAFVSLKIMRMHFVKEGTV